MASLGTLLILRAVFYWNIGPALKWTATINLVPVSLPMRSDLFPLMLGYSFASFGLTVGLYYSWLLMLSVINRNAPPDDVIHKFVRMQLGMFDRLPAGVKLLLPVVLAAVAWAVSVPFLEHYGILPRHVSKLHLIQQYLVVGLSAILGWRGILIALLVAHVVTTYIFLGDQPVWKYVEMSGRNLKGWFKFTPIGFLHAGARLSIVLLFVVLGLSWFFSSAFSRMFARLPW